jgi:hypothetical protein
MLLECGGNTRKVAVMVRREGQHLDTPILYRPPSWSWASVDGNIIPADHTVAECLIHVEDVVLNHASEDMTGAVTGGWLDLRGMLKPMKLREGEENQAHGPKWFISIHNYVVGYTVEKDEVKTRTVFLDVEPINGSACESDNDEGLLFFMSAQEATTRFETGLCAYSYDL